MGKFAKYNAKSVLEQVEHYLDRIDEQWGRKYRIRSVYEPLSIFDWWPDYIGVSKLRDMRKFLRTAIERGYKGYVCFKVGATGCANGMWAHKKESTDGYSPDGEFLYKSFTPEYNCWAVKAADGNTWPCKDEWKSVETIKQLDELLAKIKEEA